MNGASSPSPVCASIAANRATQSGAFASLATGVSFASGSGAAAARCGTCSGRVSTIQPLCGITNTRLSLICASQLSVRVPTGTPRVSTHVTAGCAGAGAAGWADVVAGPSDAGFAGAGAGAGTGFAGAGFAFGRIGGKFTADARLSRIVAVSVVVRDRKSVV